MVTAPSAGTAREPGVQLALPRPELEHVAEEGDPAAARDPADAVHRAAPAKTSSAAAIAAGLAL